MNQDVWTSILIPPVYCGAAMYKIRLTGSHIKAIPRWQRVDGERVLMIGQSNCLTQRLSSFVRAFSDGVSNHSEGRTLWCLNKTCSLSISLKTLEYCFIPVGNKIEAEKLEANTILGYIKSFGELPPLNGVVPGHLRRIV